MNAFTESTIQADIEAFERGFGCFQIHDEFPDWERTPIIASQKPIRFSSGELIQLRGRDDNADKPYHARPIGDFPDKGYHSRSIESFRDETYYSLPSLEQVTTHTPSPPQTPAIILPTFRSEEPFLIQPPTRRRCPVKSCVKEYQKKGYFIKHFLKEHEKYSQFYTVHADMDSRPRFWSCDVCERARFDKASTLANHIWTHMPELPIALAPFYRNSSCIPSSVCEPLNTSTNLAFTSGLLAASNNEQMHTPVVTVDNFQSGQNSPSQQFLETGSTQQMTEPVGIQKQPIEIKNPSPLSSASEHEGYHIQLCANEKRCANVPEGITHWVDAIKDATSILSQPPSIWSPLTTLSSPSVASHHAVVKDEGAITSSRALIFELFEILQDTDEETNIDSASSVDLNTLQDTESSPLVTNGSGSDESPNSNSMSGIVSSGVGNKRSHPPNDSPSDEEDGGGPPKKKPEREQDPFNLDTPTSKSRCKRIPCTQSDCLGTDEEMSLLLRSLISHHRIVICPGCCTRLAVKAEEKSEEVWKFHKAEQCQRRCIGRTCSVIGDDIVVPHRRTAKCLSWRALDDEDKWAFIYTLANPGQQPPTPEISEGVGLRHSSQRIPRQSNRQSSRARGAEIVEALSKEIEAKNRRITELENGLKAANDRNAQLQQRCNDQHSDQEYLIWTLLERLTDNNMIIPGSIQARLRSHCPGLMSKPEIISMLSRNQVLLPTPLATPHTSQQQTAKDIVDMGEDLNPDVINSCNGFGSLFDLGPWEGSSSTAGTGS